VGARFRFELRVGAGVLAAWVAAVLALPGHALAQAAPPARSAASAESGPRWEELTPAQRKALQPLQGEWSGIDASRKQKWVEIATRYPTLPQAEQERISARMTEWAKMSPAERGRARLNFQNVRQLTPEERQARWQAYQSLSPEERDRLAARAAPKNGSKAAPRNGAEPSRRLSNTTGRDGVQRKSNIVPNPTFAATPRPVSPSVVQAAPGATTSLISKRPTPPTHQQPGLPKIAATPGFVDKQTLLPQRGAQGAAALPQGPARPASR